MVLLLLPARSLVRNDKILVPGGKHDDDDVRSIRAGAWARWTREKADLNLRRLRRCREGTQWGKVLDTLFENESIWPESLQHGTACRRLMQVQQLTGKAMWWEVTCTTSSFSECEYYVPPGPGNASKQGAHTLSPTEWHKHGILKQHKEYTIGLVLGFWIYMIPWEDDYTAI